MRSPLRKLIVAGKLDNYETAVDCGGDCFACIQQPAFPASPQLTNWTVAQTSTPRVAYVTFDQTYQPFNDVSHRAHP